MTVSTREFPNRWEVSVADDGAGFDPTPPPIDDEKAMLDALHDAIASFTGWYMAQYSWAEETAAQLFFALRNREAL